MNKNQGTKLEAKFILPLVVFAAFVGFAAAGLMMGGASRQPDEIGRAAPELRLPALGSAEKNRERLEHYRGRPILINFFASWCLPCIAENDFLMEIAKERRMPVIGIAYKDKPAKALGFLKRYGDPYSLVLSDEDGQAGIEWGVSGVPETFLIGPDGAIEAHYAGPLTQSAWDATFEKLLK